MRSFGARKGSGQREKGPEQKEDRKLGKIPDGS